MNERGVMFTLMTVLLIIAVVALNAAAQGASLESQKLDSVVSFMNTGNRFGNIYRNIVDLKKFGTSREVTERILPFRYEVDANWVKIKRTFPVDSFEVETYFDTLNLYAVFAEEQTVSPRADLNTIQNSEWNGTEENLRFLFEPFCYQYTFYALDTVRFEEATTTKCSGSFSFSDLNVFEANIKFLYVDDDYDAVECNGSPSCPSTAYSPTDPDPYYKVTIDDSKCAVCWTPPGNKSISAHIGSGESMLIEIYCNAAPCNSAPIEISINKNLDGTMEVVHQGPRIVDVNTTIGFEGAIEQFYLLDFNVSVQSIDGKAFQTNNPSALN